MAEPTVTNESYKVKQVQILTAACVAPLMYSLGAKYTPLKANTWEPSVYDQFLNADRWAKDYQVVDFHHDGHDHRHSEYVEFSDMFYGPESDFVEGTPTLLKPVDLDVDGLTKVFDNSKGKDPLHIAYTEEVALENTVATSVKNSFTFDLTVGSETTVSGSYAGASLSQQLSTEIHTGFSKETSKDESESKTETTSVAVEFDCPAGSVKKVVITKEHQRILTPISGQFVIDFSALNSSSRTGGQKAHRVYGIAERVRIISRQKASTVSTSWSGERIRITHRWRAFGMMGKPVSEYAGRRFFVFKIQRTECIRWMPTKRRLLKTAQSILYRI